MTFDITSMLKPEVYDHPAEKLELIETHISWVILTGDFAYKIKKPVDFGFLDFSSLEKRRDYCEQELRLNRRLAPAIYLDIVAITGSSKRPRISTPDQSAGSKVLEYAVKMVQFPQSVQMDNMLAAGEIKAEDMDAIATMIAGFHQTVDIADASMIYGNNDIIRQPVTENFIQINNHLDTGPYEATLSVLTQWSEAEFVRLEAVFRERKAGGSVRECHGDMHLRNMVWLQDGPAAFDCIEFNPRLRWIDVMSEVAFLVMDLQDREQYRLASRFLNRYLEITGDYAGLSVLSYYLCYRALVRAKVCALRMEQEQAAEIEKKQSVEEFETYLNLAMSYTQPAAPRLMIMRGLSASGKSTVSQQLVERLRAIRIRSDVERKRLFDISPLTTASGVDTMSKIETGIYSKQASLDTYIKLVELSVLIINAGYSVIVDAAFLDYQKRRRFQQLADDLAVPYIIIEVTATADVLRQRIVSRVHDVSDADLSVLEHQLESWQALHQDEIKSAVSVDTGGVLEMDVLVDSIEQTGSSQSIT